MPSCWILKGDDIVNETNKRAMQVIESSSTDAARNAAMEESVFRRPEISEPVLMLYRNDESVLFGRNQNPWAECDVAFRVCVRTSHYSEDHSGKATLFCPVVRERRGESRARRRVVSPAAKNFGSLQ